MRTLQIVGSSPLGGGTFVILEWSKYLIELGVSVDILATDKPTLALLGEISGIRIIRDISIPRNIAPYSDIKAFFKLMGLLHKEQYDIVHTYTATPSILGRFASRLIKVPVCVHHQAGWPVTNFSSLVSRILYTPLEYLAVLASTRSICVSHAVAQQAGQLRIAPVSKLVTITNGIDSQPFVLAAQKKELVQRYRKEMGISDNHVLIGCTGRLARQKDYVSLIHAMALLRTLSSDRTFVLLLAGEGPDREILEGLVRKLGLEQQVHFLGFVKEIPQFLTALDIYVLPSLWEGLSISLMEAMAAGKPIITTNILPNAELIKHQENGLLVNPQSPDQIAYAIKRFTEDHDLRRRCADAAQKKVLDDYTLERMNRQTWELYVRLMDENERS